jgi:hypothetical protein
MRNNNQSRSDFTEHSSQKGKYFMSTPINMHSARTALNRDPEVRRWVEEWLKNKERIVAANMTDEEFEKHWLYVRPERMHEGAIEGVAAYQDR